MRAKLTGSIFLFAHIAPPSDGTGGIGREAYPFGGCVVTRRIGES